MKGISAEKYNFVYVAGNALTFFAWGRGYLLWWQVAGLIILVGYVSILAHDKWGK